MASPAELRVSKVLSEPAGCVLSSEVSPCSWMYRNYGLQIQVLLRYNDADFGSVYLLRKDLPFEQATTADVQALVDQVKLVPCNNNCGKPAFSPTTAKTNRSGKCESCFRQELDREYQAELALEKARQAREDAKFKAKGYTHRVTAWVHPASGDDYSIEIYAVNPSPAMIRDQLKMKRSVRLDDYTIVAL